MFHIANLELKGNICKEMWFHSAQAFAKARHQSLPNMWDEILAPLESVGILPLNSVRPGLQSQVPMYDRYEGGKEPKGQDHDRGFTTQNRYNTGSNSEHFPNNVSKLYRNGFFICEASYVFMPC